MWGPGCVRGRRAVWADSISDALSGVQEWITRGWDRRLRGWAGKTQRAWNEDRDLCVERSQAEETSQGQDDQALVSSWVSQRGVQRLGAYPHGCHFLSCWKPCTQCVDPKQSLHASGKGQ